MLGRMKNKTYANLTFWGFVLPALILFAVFFIVPLLWAVYCSFFQWYGISTDMEWIGLDNYIRLFTNDVDYAASMKFTVKYVVVSTLLTNLLGLFFAVLLSYKLPARNFFRATIFGPNIIGGIIAGYIWSFVFKQCFNSLYPILKIELLNASWLGDPDMAFVSIIICAAVWRCVGFNMVIYIAGLQGIDKLYLEAAEIDGAGEWRKLLRIKLPMLMPSITINLFMSISQGFRIYDEIFSLTDGGPGKSTMSLAIDIYKTAFPASQAGYGAAKSVVLFVIVATVTFIQLYVTGKKEVEM